MPPTSTAPAAPRRRDVVAQAVYDTLAGPLANDDSVTPAERNAEPDGRRRARAAMADLLNADPRGIVFGRSMTQLTMDLARTLAQGWGPGDEVVVTRLDHDSNVRSWTIAAERAGATVRWVDFDPDDRRARRRGRRCSATAPASSPSPPRPT